VVDYLLSRPDVDPERIALIGLSFGGYLAPRAATAEHRLPPASPTAVPTTSSVRPSAVFPVFSPGNCRTATRHC
jgi:dienelactone hydrolase